MKIAAPRLEIQGERLVYSAELTRDKGDKYLLRFEVPAAYQDWVSARADAALLTCLMPAMRRGEDIVVEGELTDELWFQLNHDYQILLRRQKRKLNKVSVTAEALVPAAERDQREVVTGFSAGVDSWQVLAQYYYADDVPENLRISHLLYNDLGSHGRGGSELFERRLKNITALAGEVGLPVLPVQSNMEPLYGRERYVSTHTIRNAAVPWLLSEKVRHFYYASAYDYSAVRIGPTRAMAEADVAALPLFSASRLTLRSVGSSSTRVQKTLSLVDIPSTYEGLDVCISPGKNNTNCSRCWKCHRTMLTLDIAQVLDRYSKTFNLKLWERTRRDAWNYAVEKSPASKLEKEVVRFGRLRNYDLALEQAEENPE
ncbi:hypothetical protein [Nesterenkonia flava]|uniref:Uncharacterized protein n=1 Tax=Nesterenkonia flava TaxID=469799 RepID=A0ABU1FQ48_9MICC|nr:hypothetical protein [Nesterenkonia flava]MDR5710766.1 hypothetical protein [Nesterenkonia flava]